MTENAYVAGSRGWHAAAITVLSERDGRRYFDSFASSISTGY